MRRSKKKNSLQGYLNKLLLIMALISLLGVGFFWVYTEYTSFMKEALALRSRFMNEQKEHITREVNKTLDLIDYNQQLSEERLVTNIKLRVYEAYDIALNLYEKNKNKMNNYELEILVKEALRPVRYNNGRGYYFAVNMAGVEKLYPVAPQFEETNLLELQDEKDNFVIQDEIVIVKEKGEGFVRNFWRKPNASDEMIYPKITFVKYFEPLDWYIGSGEYLDDVEHDIQQESLERISQMRFGRNGTITVTNYDGVSLIAHGQIVDSQINMINIEDAFGHKVIEQEIDLVKKSKAGFIQSYWKRPESDIVEKKVAYVAGFDKWEWIISAGFFITDIESEIVMLRNTLSKQVTGNIIKIMVILISITFIVFVTGRLTFQRIDRNVKVFHSFFRNAIDKSTLINKQNLNFQEFEILADSGNEMIQKRNEALLLLQKSEEKYRVLVRNLGEGVLIFDNARNFLFANKAAEDIFGLPETKLIGKNLDAFQIEKDEHDNEDEIRIKNFLGEERVIKITSTERYDELDQQIGTFEIFHDVTKNKILERERNKNRESLNLVNKILRHDLTNDLSVISSAVHLYESDQREELLQEITKRVEKSLDTINMARKQEFFFNKHSELFKVDINEVLAGLKEHYNQLEIKIEGRGSVLADELLHSVFENLISNSITHGKATELIISIKTEKEFCNIQFADNGVGIPDIQKNKVFEEGYIYGHSGHTGIGLFIVKETIERYEGSMFVKDNLPKGAIFEINLLKSF